MKTTGLLLCLALAGASGSIFRRQTTNTNSLIAQPQDYIPQQFQLPIYQQYQQTDEENQKSEHSYNHNHVNTHQEHHSHSSSDSSQSQESREKISEQHDQFNRHHESKYWKHFTFVKQGGEIPMYSEPIVWKDLTIAVGPKSAVKTKDDIEKIFGDAHQIISQIPEEQKTQLHEGLLTAIRKDNEDAHLNASQLIQKYNYPVEAHTVMTDDGYQLTMFRIPPKMELGQVQKKQVVMLMHGLLGSADDWLLQGPGKSLAFLLAEIGHDVWLGNTRGSKYSRQHVSKHPALNEFWKFSNDEIALHDLPAMINYALQTSGQEKLHYVGHAQGSTTFFALASEKPDYNNKIISMHALSPMVYMSNARSPLVRMIAPTSIFYDNLHEELGHGAFKPSKELLHTTGGALCLNAIGSKNVCSNVNFVLSGIDMAEIDPEMIYIIMGHLPAGTSTRVMKHYGQAVASGDFRKYDYGVETNKQVYGTPEPPQYDMQKIHVPVSVYYSEEDWLAHPTDVQKLVNELPIVKSVTKVPEKHFNHMDFQFSKKAPEAVYKKIMETMQSTTI